MPAIAPVRADLIWFDGDDALRFLNDIISQQIEDMTTGDARRSFLLAPQGKLDFLLWVLRDGNRFGLLTEPGRGEELASALGRYRIRVDVDIVPEERDVWIVMGEWDGYDVSWADVSRHVTIGDRPELEEMTSEEYERLRVGAGEPKWGIDVDEGTIPHESGLVPASVEFSKGCYLGQELVARIDSRGGNTPRRLRLIESEGPMESGSPVIAEDDEVGTVTSAAGNMALAMLKRSVSVGDRVEVRGLPAVVRDLPLKN